MATFFEPATIFSMENSIEYSSGGVISKQVIKKQSGNVTLFSFDKDQGLTEHTSPFDAMVHLIDGEAEIRISGTPYHLKKGECIIMPAGHPHALHAIEPFKMILTMIKQ
ncbi:MULTISPECIES: cupin domain-containing protein [Petrimonas]|jgi:quercetin dioxygenase-like cupin family protein|uniref:Cupin domain protein n=1 Tax=Petrimonas mucosa TaxID=1642646 RepID=A0A1G4G640_9BACT|nr:MULTISPECIES: cupin domain-containing protein [Petrimonas]MDD3560435.1 cupin domain-containing protein [Petrimonas mucosa]SCM56984.1 Cupin domain protein {ECO:0000313/EMBL:BAR49750,1} [Petrimonas mucosa]SFU50380.1 Cupin domain protein [Porphyromonadaceae bacterium KHP3R9]HHT29724.1 cupin domain-containing protein [Petrimonas mucosa]